MCKVEEKKNISGEKTCSSCVQWKLWTWKLVKRFLISFQLYKLQRKKVVPLFIFQGSNIFVRKEGKVFEGESQVQAEIFLCVWNVRFSIFLTKKTLLTKVYFILSHMKKISSPESTVFHLVSQVKKLNLKFCRSLLWYILFTHVKTNMNTNSPDFVFFPPRNIKISFHQFPWLWERKLFISDWHWISTKKQFLTCPSGLPYLKSIFLDCLFALNPNTSRIIDVLQMLSFRHPAAVKVPSEPMFLAKLVN